MDPFFTRPLNVEELLLRKQLTPLTAEQVATIAHVQNYPIVENFNEAEVRSYIIDPILRVLGYDKGTPFSTNLEKTLRILGQARRPDYQLMLWEENFWLLEAKRPRVGEPTFGYDDFSQALEYSIHPSVNAALIVLCDGLKLEVFDREMDLDAPILHIEIKNLVAEFDKLRALLEPIQIWFFEKRRAVRLLDRVFSKEFILGRSEEFLDLIKSRLAANRNSSLENFRRMVKPDTDAQLSIVGAAPLPDLVEFYMMFDFPIPIDNAVNAQLVRLSLPNSFHPIHRIFPPHPRPVNDSYMSQAAAYLVALKEKRDTVEYLPSWLGTRTQSGVELEPAIKNLLDLCLTHFEGYEPYRLILLAACAAARISKIFALSSNFVQKLGEELHAMARFALPEISWTQVVASPESQIIGMIDRWTQASLSEFVKKNTAENGQFKLESAKLELKSYWNLEKRLLAAIPNYPTLLTEKNLGAMRMTEWSSVTYDNLGHCTICRLHRFPHWKKYLLDERRPLVETVASTGSWAAREMLGLKREDHFEPMSDKALADRFFLGDIETLRAIKAGYTKKR